MPSPEHVRRAKEAIKRAADLEFFFEKLTSADWIKPLEDEGFFDEPWGPQSDGQYVSFPLWPQSKYLARMADRVPDLVLSVIERIPATENVRIHEDFADAALAMPASTAAKIVPKAAEWLRSPYQLLLPKKLGTLLRHLVKGGETAAALDLAAALLWTEPDQDRGRPQARFEEFFYAEILKDDMAELVSVEPRGALRVLSDALEQAVTAGKTAEPDDQREDYSSMWQPAVEEHEQNNDYDVRPALVAAVTNTAEAALTAGRVSLGDLFRVLDAMPSKIFTRIGLHLVREFADRDPGLAKELVRDKARTADATLHHEYWRLAHRAFPLFSPLEQEEFLDQLEAERQMKEQEVELADSPEGAEQRKRSARHWLYRRLTLLKDRLPARGLAQLQELAREFSEIEHPEFLSYSTGVWMGPSSPKSVDEVAVMSVDDLVEFIRKWTPSGQPMDGSPEGLARSIEPVVAAGPEKYAARALAFAGLDPTYVRAVVAGLRQARKNRRPLSWEPVLELCEWIVAQPRTITGRQIVGDEDDADPDWGWTRREIAGLLEVGFDDGEGPLPLHLRDRVWSILAQLTQDPDPTPGHELRYGGGNMDPFTLSINTVRGVAMHAVVKYALWVRGAMDEARRARGLAEMPEVREVLEDHLRLDYDPSQSTRAVYGRWLPWLHLLDQDWTRAHLPDILPRDEVRRPLRDAAWGAYLMYSRLFDDVYKLLRDEYSIAIDRLEKEHFGGARNDHPDLRLVDHLMLFYLRGLIDLRDEHDLLQRFYRTAPAEFRERAIRFLGHALHDDQAKILPPDVRARFQELLDLRIESQTPWTEKAKELAAFGWWFATGKLETGWAMSRLITVLREGRKIEATHLVVKQLAAVAQSDPVGASLALRWVIAVDTKGWAFSPWVEEGRAILQLALQHTSPEARENARQAIDLLAAKGNRSFVDLVQG